MYHYKSPRASSQFKLNMNTAALQSKTSLKLQVSTFKRDLSRQETEESLPMLDTGKQSRPKPNGEKVGHGGQLAQSVFIAPGRRDAKPTLELASQQVSDSAKMTSSQVFQTPKRQFRVYNLAVSGSTGKLPTRSAARPSIANSTTRDVKITVDFKPPVQKFNVSTFAVRTLASPGESLDDSKHIQGGIQRGNSLARRQDGPQARPSVVKIQSPKAQVPSPIQPRGASNEADQGEESVSVAEKPKKNQSYLLNVNGIEYKVPLLDPIESSSLILKRRCNTTPNSESLQQSTENLMSSRQIAQVRSPPRQEAEGETMVSRYFKSNQAKEFMIKRKALGRV